MPRSPASSADKALIDILARRGYQVSPYQLERWRSMGVLPRNIRRGRGRGLGSSSVLPDQAIPCAVALAWCSRWGGSVAVEIEEHFYEVARYSAEEAQEIPERMVRSALRHLAGRADIASVDEDRAYEEAAIEAKADKTFLRGGYSYWHQLLRSPNGSGGEGNRRNLNEYRPAYEQVKAAMKLGVHEVGEELLGESLVKIGWVTREQSEWLTKYLSLVLRKSHEHQRLFSSLNHRELCSTGLLAARLWSAHWFPDRLRGTGFSWISTCTTSLVLPRLLHAAIASDPELLDEATSVASSPEFLSDLGTKPRLRSADKFLAACRTPL